MLKHSIIMAYFKKSALFSFL